MKISNEQYERLMRFLDMDMSVSEMKEFVKELETNIDLQEQLEFEQSIRDGLEVISKQESGINLSSIQDDEERAAFRKQVESINRELSGEKKHTANDSAKRSESIRSQHKSHQQNIFKLWMPAAIAACLLIAIALFITFRSDLSPKNNIAKKDTIDKKNNTQLNTKPPAETIPSAPEKTGLNFAKIFNAFYRKDTLPVKEPELLANALIDYADNDYRKIQKIELDYLPTQRGSDNDTINSENHVKTVGHYYKGLSYIETSDLKKATENLQWVKDSTGNRSYLLKAQWYLALAYLKMGNPVMAIPLLKTVENSNINTPLKKQAADLLKEIE